MLTNLLLASLPVLPLQDGQETWIPTDAGVQGTPDPTVTLVESLSDASKTVLDVSIPGFYTEPVQNALEYKLNRCFVKSWSVGGAAHGQSATTEDLGAPELPVLRLSLLVPPGCEFARLDPVGSDLGTVATFKPSVLDPNSEGGDFLPLYPVHEPAWDGDPEAGIPVGTPEAFAGFLDDYGPTGAYPATHFDDVVAAQPGLAGLNTVELEIRPFRWNDTDGLLEVVPKFRLCYLHPSADGTTPPATIVQPGVRAAATAGFFNGSEAQLSTGENYQGRYLIYTREEYLDVLWPFIHHRSLSGFSVAVRYLDNLEDTTPDSIRAGIQEWYSLSEPGTDNFCLLIGTTADVPLVPAPTSVGTLGDDMYGSPVDGDLSEELYVGRIALPFVGDREAEIVHQLDKVIAYETHDALGYDFDRLLMVSHEEGAPGKYTGLVLDVAQELDDHDPEIDTPLALGNLAGSTDDYVTDQINQEVGYVMYRGHGSTKAWTEWNTADQYYGLNDVPNLTNEQLSIYWSISCSNGRTQLVESNARAWMSADAGAAAAYAAQGVTKTLANHETARWLARLALKNQGIPHGIVIAFAESLMEAQFAGEYAESNAWHYSLLGCPAMPCRTDSHQIQFELQQFPDGLTVIDGQLVDPNAHDGAFTLQPKETSGLGLSLVGTRGTWVAAQAGLGSDGELVQAVSETVQLPDEDHKALGFDGSLSIADVGGDLPRELEIGVRWPTGQLETLEIPLKWGSFENLLGGAADQLGNQPFLATDDVLAGGEAFELEVWNAEPSSTGALFLSLNSLPVPLEGAAVFHAFPVFQSAAFATDPTGHAVLTQGPLPAELPAGLELTYQAVVIDPDSPTGLTLTNALQGGL